MRLLSIVFLVLTFSISSFAQETKKEQRIEKGRKKMKEKMEAQKIAFITQELDLSSDEAQRFWPVYNQYSKELETLRKDKPRGRKQEEVVLTDEEASAELNAMIAVEKRHIALKENYIGQMKDVISIQKVAKLFRLENRFKREMLNKLGKSRKKRKMKEAKKPQN